MIALGVAHAVQCPYCIDAYTSDALEKGADVILLNEVDVGMARSSNRHVAHDLAELRSFLRGLGRERWDEVVLPDLQSFLDHLAGQGTGPRSRARKLSAVRQFYRFLLREGLSTHNPLEWLDALVQGIQLVGEHMGIAQGVHFISDDEVYSL